MPNLLGFEFIENFVKGNNFILHNSDCSHSDSKIIIEDVDGYYYSSTWDNLYMSVKRGSELRKFHKCNDYSLYNLSLYLYKKGNLSEYISGEYLGMKNKNLKFKCGCGKTFKTSVASLIRKDSLGTCEICSEKERTRPRKNIDEVLNVLENLKLRMIDEETYVNLKTPFLVECKVCGYKYEKLMGTIKNNRACQRCNKSKGNRTIENFLTKNNIPFYPEKRFDDCMAKSYLFFDFYLENQNCCIEYNGEQHYKPVDFSRSSGKSQRNLERAKKEFEGQVYNDKIKKKYCKKKGIFLLTISYKDFNKIEEILRVFLKTNGGKQK